jgi:hypothetical protein
VTEPELLVKFKKILNVLATDNEIFDNLRFMYVLSPRIANVQISKILKEDLDNKLENPEISEGKCFRLLIQHLIESEEEWIMGNYEKLYKTSKEELTATYD